MARIFTVQITGEDAVVTRVVEGVGRVKRLIEQVTGTSAWVDENISHRLANMTASEAYSPTPDILVTVEGGDEVDGTDDVDDGENDND